VTHGATMIFPSEAFEPLAVLEAVSEERCTALHGVPTMFIAALDHVDFDSFDYSHLRTGIMAGAPCPIELMKRVVNQMNMKEVLIGYGQTEASPLTTCTRPADPLERRVSTVGKVMPLQELKIVSPLTGKTVPHDEPGEICFRGYMVMSGYDNNPEATAEAVDDQGWLHSGDLGTMDDEGYIKITGRIKEMVIRGGENLYPREIEEFLHTLDIIQDVHVIGVPDIRMGEELCACVKLHEKAAQQPPTPDEFKALCKGKIAHFKIPRYWWVIDEYPMTVTGKVQKFKLRDLAVRQFNLEQAAKVETA